MMERTTCNGLDVDKALDAPVGTTLQFTYGADHTVAASIAGDGTMTGFGGRYPLFTQTNASVSVSAVNFFGLYGLSAVTSTAQGITSTSRLSRAGVISDLTATIAADAGNGKTYTICLYDLDAAACTALTCTITGNGSTGVSCTDTSHPITLAPSSTYNWGVTPGGTPTAQSFFINFTFTPTVPY